MVHASSGPWGSLPDCAAVCAVTWPWLCSRRCFRKNPCVISLVEEQSGNFYSPLSKLSGRQKFSQLWFWGLCQRQIFGVDSWQNVKILPNASHVHVNHVHGLQHPDSAKGNVTDSDNTKPTYIYPKLGSAPMGVLTLWDPAGRFPDENISPFGNPLKAVAYRGPWPSPFTLPPRHWDRLFSWDSCDRRRGFKLKEDRFTLDIRKKYFMMWIFLVLHHWKCSRMHSGVAAVISSLLSCMRWLVICCNLSILPSGLCCNGCVGKMPAPKGPSQPYFAEEAAGVVLKMQGLCYRALENKRLPCYYESRGEWWRFGCLLEDVGSCLSLVVCSCYYNAFVTVTRLKN